MNRERRRGLVLFLLQLGLAALSGLSGCTTVSDLPAPPAPVVAVLINRTWVEQDPRGFAWEVSKDELATEQRFAACVSEAAAAAGYPVRVITGTEFRAKVFPDLDPRGAPRGIETLRALLPEPRFRQRVEAAGTRYLAVLGGETRTSETKGEIVCVGGYGRGGCFGLLWWDHESRFSALVIDLVAGNALLKEGIDASGTSWFAMLAAFPLALPSGHEAAGCVRFGQAITEILLKMRAQGG